ncbi:MAG: universal stress protein [Planctomycetes bacterium]|nr:universal stress protein [Planctomycetota bacterium]
MSFLPKKKIVVPVDFSGESANAIQVAREMAASLESVHLLHVLFPLDSVSPGVVWGDVSDEHREEKIRDAFNDLIAANNLSGVNVTVRFGNPGLEIAEYAGEIDADLIVIPSHGYHGVKRLVLGSVAERVIRHANCSVMVLRRSDAD